jgi:prephenate dehydrogenase
MMDNILVVGLDERSCELIKFLKSKKLYNEINGYDLDFDRFKSAINRDLINNKEYDNFEKIIIKSDIIILNISIERYDIIFSKISPFVQKDCIITDINSSKEQIYKFKTKNLNIRKDNYIQSNCLFNINKIENAINKKVLINSNFGSNLENINRLSLFWKMYNFDTESLNVTDNDILIGKVLHLPFILKMLLKKVVKDEDFFVIVNEEYQYLFDDIILNTDNLIKYLKLFTELISSLHFTDEISRVFFNKTLKARENLRKIYDIYGLKLKKEANENMHLSNAINFLLEMLFLGEFLGFREYLYLNMDIFNFGLASGQEFICLNIIENDKIKFLELWNLLIKKIVDFTNFLTEKKNLKVEDITNYNWND